MFQISIFQIVIGVLALSTALGVVFAKNAVSSALCLMGTLFLTAFLYLAQGAYFAGIVQILIYAGAVAVLFVFIVMLLDLKETKVLIPGQKTAAALSVTAAAIFVIIVFVLSVSGFLELAPKELNLNALSAKAIASNFVSTYMLPFQVTGLLILAAVLGVVMLAKSTRAISNKEDSNGI